MTNIYPGEVNTPLLENRPVPVTDERKAAMLQPEDFGELVVAIACLHPRAHVSEMVIKPTRAGVLLTPHAAAHSTVHVSPEWKSSSRLPRPFLARASLI